MPSTSATNSLGESKRANDAHLQEEVINGLLGSCNEECKRSGGELLAATPPAAYVDALARLFDQTCRTRCADSKVEELTIDVKIRNRQPSRSDTENPYKDADLAGELVAVLFPFDMRPHALTSWLAVKAVFLTRTGPNGFAPFMKTWSPDLHVALIVQIGGSINSMLSEVGNARSGKLERGYLKELGLALEQSGHLPEYLADKARWVEVHEAYNRYKDLDRKFNNRRELLARLKELGLSSEMTEAFHLAYIQGGYDSVHHLLAKHFPQIFDAFDRGIEEAHRALREYIQLHALASERQFGVPFELSDKIWDGVMADERNDPYQIAVDDVFHQDRETWTKLSEADREWFELLKKGIREAFRFQKALGIDWFLRQPTSIVSEFQRFVDTKISAIDEFDNLVRRGRYLDRGVPVNARVEPAIARGMQVERDLLRFYLEFAGPNSPWTKARACAHTVGWQSRRDNGSQCSRLCEELDEIIAAL